MERLTDKLVGMTELMESLLELFVVLGVQQTENENKKSARLKTIFRQ